MAILFALLAGCVLPFVIAIFLERSREERGRVAGMLFGAYVCCLGLVGAALVVYRAVMHGSIGISRRGNSATFMFSDEPVLATLTLLVSLACTAVFTAFGWSLFKGSRNRTLP